MNTIPVICGQPRSGTSMLMRMMEFGGIAVEFDLKSNEENLREIFQNIHGFYEVVKPTYTKCFKVVNSNALKSLLSHCKLIYIDRDVEDIIKSWERVELRQKLAAEKRHRDKTNDVNTFGMPKYEPVTIEKLITQRDNRRQRVLKAKEQWQSALAEHPALVLKYADVVNDPTAAATQIAEYIQQPFDVANAAKAVDTSLLRQGKLCPYNLAPVPQ